jgi:lysophospholipase L1-like esterase
MIPACAAGPTGSSVQGLSSPPAPANANYLALGDSIAFGFNPNLPYMPPLTQFVSYAQIVAQDTGLIVANSACPGETSGSFIDATRPDNGCRSLYDYFDQGLHVDYQGAKSQLDYALAFLAAHPNTKLVTLDIGGNDLLLTKNACGSDLVCTGTRLVTTLAAFAGNLTDILARIRGAGYYGELILVTQYGTNYRDATQLVALASLKKITADVGLLFGAKIADGFGAFAGASLLTLGDACAAGLLIRNPDGTCDMHPSVQGRTILANTILAAHD